MVIVETVFISIVFVSYRYADSMIIVEAVFISTVFVSLEVCRQYDIAETVFISICLQQLFARDNRLWGLRVYCSWKANIEGRP